METPKSIQAILNELMVAPSLGLARQLEQQLSGHGCLRRACRLVYVPNPKLDNVSRVNL